MFFTRPTDYIYAKLAELVYTANEKEKGQPIPQLPGWILYATDRQDDGYFGAAYLHQETAQLIVAHRGIELPFTPELDAQELQGLSRAARFFSSLSGYFKSVKGFTQDIKSLTCVIQLTLSSQQASALNFAVRLKDTYPNYQISFAGHSLGGWLAELCTYHLMTENYYTWAVTLDSPGAKDILREIHNRYSDKIPQSKLDSFLERLDVKTYLSSPNLINSCNLHLGSLYRLYIDIPSSTSFIGKNTKDKLLYNFHSHRVESLVATFNPQTGYPDTDKFAQIIDWPRIDSSKMSNYKFDTGHQGSIQSLLTQINKLSPISAPDFLVNFVSRKIDSGVSAIINACGASIGFSQTVSIILDFISGDIRTVEYDGFFEFANSRNQYEPTADLNFSQAYFMQHKYHYKVAPNNNNILHLRHVNAEIRQFLWAYASQEKFNHPGSSAHIPDRVWSLFNAYTLQTGAGGLVENKGWTVELSLQTINLPHGYAWYAELSQAWEQHKEKLKAVLTQDARIRAQRIDAQMNGLLQRIDAIEQQQSHSISSEQILQTSDTMQHKLKEIYQARQEIKGLFGKPLQLESQFINVQLILQNKVEPIQKNEVPASAEPQEMSEPVDVNHQFQDERMSSWEHLFGEKKTIPLDQLFSLDNALFEENRHRNKSNPNEPPHFLLLQGRAGIGKTTVIDYIANQWGQGKFWSIEFTWVFALRLRDLNDNAAIAATTAGIQWSLSHWVYEMIFAGRDIKPAEFNIAWQQQIEPLLQQGKVLFLLDGYDEMPRHHPCEKALHGLLSSKIPKILTSRPYGLTHLPPARQLEVMGFTNENIEKYVGQYFSGSQQAPKIISTLKANPYLWGNAHIPVTLNVLCGVLETHEGHAALENLHSMSSLYEEMEIALLTRAYRQTQYAEQLDFASPELSAQIVLTHYKPLRQYLIAIAYKGFCEQQLIISQKQLEDCLKSCHIKPTDVSPTIKALLTLGLLKSVAGNNDADQNKIIGYEFLHLTFQEYYSGLKLAHDFIEAKSETDPLLASFRAFKFDPRYQMVFWFAAGILNTNPTGFDKLMKFIDSKFENDIIGHAQLGLQLRCTNEAWDAAKETGWQMSIAKTLQRKLADCYELFKAHHYSRYNSLAWSYTEYDGTFPWVILLQTSPKWQKASGDLDLFSNINPPEEEDNLRSLLSYISWMQLKSPKILNILLSLLQEQKIADNAATVIGRNYKNSITPELLSKLLLILDTEYRFVYMTFFKIIGMLGPETATPDVLSVIEQCLNHENTLPQDKKKNRGVVRIALAKVVKNLQYSAATPEILAAILILLEDSNEDVQQAALDIICEFKIEALIPQIISIALRLIDSQKEQLSLFTKNLIISALGPTYITTEILNTLLNLIKDEDVRNNDTVIDIITQIGVAHADAKFCMNALTLLKHESFAVRCFAAKTAAHFNQAQTTPDFLARLVTLLWDENIETRSLAVNLINRFNLVPISKNILVFLSELIENKNLNKRSHITLLNDWLSKPEVTAAEIFAIQILGFVSEIEAETPYIISRIVSCLNAIHSPPEVMDEICNLLQHKNKSVRILAVKIIGKRGVQNEVCGVLNVISKMLSDNRKDVKISALYALNLLGASAATSDILISIEKLLQDKNLDADVRSAVIDVISAFYGKVNTHQLIPLFKILAEDKDVNVQRVVIDALLTVPGTLFKAPQITAAFSSLKENKNKDIRVNAALILYQFNKILDTDDSFDFLADCIKISNDMNDTLRYCALEIANQFGSTFVNHPKIFAAMMSLLDYENRTPFITTQKAVGYVTKFIASNPRFIPNKVIEFVVKIIHRHGNSMNLVKILTVITDYLSHEDYICKIYFLDIMRNLNRHATEPEFLKILETLLADPFKNVRVSALDALANFGAAAATLEIMTLTITLLQDNNTHHTAARTIYKLGFTDEKPEIITAVKALCNNEKYWSHELITEAIENFRSTTPSHVFLSGFANILLQVKHTKNIPEYCTNLTLHYLKNQNCILNPNAKKISLILLIGSYFSGNISGGLVWQTTTASYAWQGFVGKTPFSLQLTLDHAKWLAHAAPKIIEKIEQLQWDALIQLLESPDENISTLRKMMLPLFNTDNADNANASASNLTIPICEGILRFNNRITIDIPRLNAAKKEDVLLLVINHAKNCQPTNVIKNSDGNITSLEFDRRDQADNLQRALVSSHQKKMCVVM
ncbi:MAG: NACHT domain-containing protein [Legionellales bacterium]|jgi:HEAT repeat protein